MAESKSEENQIEIVYESPEIEKSQALTNDPTLSKSEKKNKVKYTKKKKKKSKPYYNLSHEKSNKSKKSYACTMCNEKFYQKNKLQQHECQNKSRKTDDINCDIKLLDKNLTEHDIVEVIANVTDLDTTKCNGILFEEKNEKHKCKHCNECFEGEKWQSSLNEHIERNHNKRVAAFKVL